MSITYSNVLGVILLLSIFWNVLVLAMRPTDDLFQSPLWTDYNGDQTDDGTSSCPVGDDTDLGEYVNEVIWIDTSGHAVCARFNHYDDALDQYHSISNDHVKLIRDHTEIIMHHDPGLDDVPSIFAIADDDEPDTVRRVWESMRTRARRSSPSPYITTLQEMYSPVHKDGRITIDLVLIRLPSAARQRPPGLSPALLAALYAIDHDPHLSAVLHQARFHADTIYIVSPHESDNSSSSSSSPNMFWILSHIVRHDIGDDGNISEKAVTPSDLTDLYTAMKELFQDMNGEVALELLAMTIPVPCNILDDADRRFLQSRLIKDTPAQVMSMLLDRDPDIGLTPITLSTFKVGSSFHDQLTVIDCWRPSLTRSWSSLSSSLSSTSFLPRTSSLSRSSSLTRTSSLSRSSSLTRTSSLSRSSSLTRTSSLSRTSSTSTSTSASSSSSSSPSLFSTSTSSASFELSSRSSSDSLLSEWSGEQGPPLSSSSFRSLRHIASMNSAEFQQFIEEPSPDEILFDRSSIQITIRCKIDLQVDDVHFDSHPDKLDQDVGDTSINANSEFQLPEKYRDMKEIEMDMIISNEKVSLTEKSLRDRMELESRAFNVLVIALEQGLGSIGLQDLGLAQSLIDSFDRRPQATLMTRFVTSSQLLPGVNSRFTMGKYWTASLAEARVVAGPATLIARGPTLSLSAQLNLTGLSAYVTPELCKIEASLLGASIGAGLNLRTGFSVGLHRASISVAGFGASVGATCDLSTPLASISLLSSSME